MAKFEMHAAAYILELEHRASPGGAGDGDLDGLRAEFGMAGEKRFAAAQKHGGVAMIQGLDLEDGGRRKIAQVDATFDFRPDDAAVHFVGQVGMGAKHGGVRRRAYRISDGRTRVLLRVLLRRDGGAGTWTLEYGGVVGVAENWPCEAAEL